MNRIVPVALLLSTIGAGAVLAQTTTTPAPSTATSPAYSPSTSSPPSSSTAPPAVATRHGNNTTAAPVPGKNSFTMAQAKKRLEKDGYTQVSALVKDANSIWRGHAMKDGKPVDVSLDYQGNITAN